MLAELRQDAARMKSSRRSPFPLWLIEALLFENGFQAVVLYRFARWFREHGIPFVGPFLTRISIFLTGVELSPAAEIGPGLKISHGVGTVVGGFARIGSGALLLHQVTLGALSEGRIDQMPVVGDNVFLGAGAKLIGAIEVGDDVVVGPNAVIFQDVPSGSKVLSTAAVEITPRGGAA